jgi:hypothetical protein
VELERRYGEKEGHKGCGIRKKIWGERKTQRA